MVSAYPVEFPRIKNASLKWAWKQPPKRGWCELPISITHRLASGGKLSMLGLMREIEATFAFLTKSVSTVVETTDKKKKTKWLSEAEIGVMAMVLPCRRKMNEEHLCLSRRRCSEKSAQKLWRRKSCS